MPNQGTNTADEPQANQYSLSKTNKQKKNNKHTKTSSADGVKQRGSTLIPQTWHRSPRRGFQCNKVGRSTSRGVLLSQAGCAEKGEHPWDRRSFSFPS